MKDIRIDKELQSSKKDGNCFYLGFIGSAEDNFDISDIEEFLNNHESSIADKYNLADIIQIIRTLFRDVKEHVLTIEYQFEGGWEKIEYDDGMIVFYEKHILGSKKYSIDYVVGEEIGDFKGFKFEYNNPNKNYGSKSNKEYPHSELIKVLNTIDSYSKIEKVNLTDEAKYLIEIYNIFFNEAPDFSDPNIKSRIQSMACLLYCFDVYSEYDFVLNKNTPYSLDLAILVSGLYPYGKVNMDEIVEVGKEIAIKDTISKLSKKIMGLMENVKNKDQALAKIAKYLYIKRFCLFEDAKIQDVAVMTNCSEEEIASYDKLRKEANKLVLEF